MKKIDFQAPGVDVIQLINTGEKILDATIPWINQMITNIRAKNSDNVHTPAGRTAHILAGEAINKLQDQKLALYESYFAQLHKKGYLEIEG